jgi:hypothetical protein
MAVTLEVSAYDALVRRLPELGTGLNGGSRWIKHKRRDTAWPKVDGAKWELQFMYGWGLVWVMARYPSENELRAAIAGWGEPNFRGRMGEFWLDDASHTQASFDECFQPTADGKPSAEPECTLVFKPQQTPEAFLERILPKGRTLVGVDSNALDLGESLYEGDYIQYLAWPLPGTQWVPVRIQFDGGKSGRVVSYRTLLEYTHDNAAAKRYARALSERLPGLEAGLPDLGTITDCATVVTDGVPVQVCKRRSEYVITVGIWR